MIELELSTDEILAGVVVAATRKLASDRRRANGRESRRAEHYEERRTWDQEIESALAEVAVARWRDKYWMGAYFNGANAGTDAGRSQVRWTDHAGGHLIVYPEDADGALFVLVTGCAPTKRLVGWAWARDVKQPRYWREPPSVKAASWWAPQADLNPIRTEDA